MKRLKKIFKLLFLGVLFLLVLGFIYQRISQASDAKNSPPVGEVVAVEDTDIHLNISGAGDTTVVLIAGAGDIEAIWEPVQSQLEKHTKVISYDRPGLGQSDFYSGDNLTLEKQAELLYEALGKSSNSGPYIVVGHSLGGLIARRFAKKYPSDVVGVVLVDSSVEGQFSVFPKEVLEANKSAGSAFAVASVAAQFGLPRLFGFGAARAQGFDLLSAEAQKRIAVSMDQTRAFKALQRDGAVGDETMETGESFPDNALGNTPVIVITRGLAEQDVNTGIAYSQAQIDLFSTTQEIWLQLQRDLLKISSNSIQIIAPNSGHYVHTTEPELVVDAIESMLD